MKVKANPLCLLFAVVSISSSLLMPPAIAGIPLGNKKQSFQSPLLRNKDILEMQKMGLSPEIILAKMKSSECNFDTSTEALQELKSAAVSDAIILAMVQTSVKATPSAVSFTSPAVLGPATVGSVDVTIPDGTQVEIELRKTISSEDEKEGDVVDFAVVQPVIADGIKVIKQNAAARGHIARAKKSGRWGRQGKLDWAMNDAVGIDGNRIPLRFTKAARGDSAGGTVAIAAIATTVLLGPLGLLWGLKKGKPAIIPAGNRYTVFVHGNIAVKGEAPRANVQDRQLVTVETESERRVQVPAKQKDETPPPTIVNLDPRPNASKRKPTN